MLRSAGGTANNASNLGSYLFIPSSQVQDHIQPTALFWNRTFPFAHINSCLTKYSDISYANRVSLFGNCISPWFNLETAYCPDTPYCAPCTERYSSQSIRTKFVEIFPNPTSNFFTIQNLRKGSTISLQNVLGEYVISKKVDSEELNMDISSLQAGLYLVVVDGIIQNKVIKLE